MDLPDRLREARRRAGLSQAELVEAAGLDPRMRPFLSNWETGRRQPPPETITRIAYACGVDPDWLSTDPPRAPQRPPEPEGFVIEQAPPLDTVGRRIWYARKSASMSQSAVAQRTGLSQNHISQWERGQREPTDDDLAAVAEVIGETLDWLRSGKL